MFWIILAFIVAGGVVYANRKRNYRNVYNIHKPDNHTRYFSEAAESDKPDPDFDDFTEEEIEYDYLLRQQEEQDEEEYYIEHMHDE